MLPRSLLLTLTILELYFRCNVTLAARGPIQDAIQSGAAADYHKDECTWRKESESFCPDPDIHLYIHRFGKNKLELKYDDKKSGDWLNNDLYDEKANNIFLIHGYNGGEDVLPMAILRDTYVSNGSYNVFTVDWGKLGENPCYPAAVANLRFVASCLSQSLTTLRDLGLSISKTTCVGHSLGAHICGIMSNYLPFRWRRIIGMDPAKPLVRPGRSNKLDISDADFVQIIHTNAGYFGESGREGHVDFCANGGKLQPFCEYAEKTQLCSHNWSICFIADSIDGRSELSAEPCTGRCPPPRRIGPRSANAIFMGQYAPFDARGTFCVTTVDSPYCPKHDNDRGDKRCCV